jgi:hypothetical protein
MAEQVRSAGPVSTVGGFAGRATGHTPPQPKKGRDPDEPARAPDRVDVPAVASDVLRLLRERVLARTRVLLGIDDGVATPEFAEIIDGEPVPAFLGRLLSAQNQLAARCPVEWSVAVIRAHCHEAVLAGAAETLELLASNRRADPGAPAVVGEVLAEHARRLAVLAPDAGAPPVP